MEPEGKYWAVKSVEPYLSVSLEKLGVPKEKIKIWVPFISIRKDREFVYIQYDDEEGFGWATFTKNSQDWYKEHNYTYKGRLKIEDFEVDANQYNL